MTDIKDLLERVVSTFIQAAGGMLATDQIVNMDVAEWKLVLGAGGAAVLAMLKGYCASRFSGNGSASLLVPKDQDHELDAMYGESE